MYIYKNKYIQMKSKHIENTRFSSKWYSVCCESKQLIVFEVEVEGAVLEL